jgi:hypothetical protein
MHANNPEMAKKWEKKEKKMKQETKVRALIRKAVREIMAEDFGGQLPKTKRKKFEKVRKEQSEVLGYKLTGTSDVKTEAKKRDYKAEYKKFQSSTKSKKYRAELNAYNRKKGTYGNGDGKDASHKGGKIAGFEKESVNRGRREKSRLKKEGKLNEKCWKGYEKKGTKKMFGKTYPNCVKKEEKLTEKKESIFDVAARVLKNKQNEKYKGVRIDLQTANLLTKVYAKVNDKMRGILTKLGDTNIKQLINTLWAVAR